MYTNNEMLQNVFGIPLIKILIVDTQHTIIFYNSEGKSTADYKL